MMRTRLISLLALAVLGALAVPASAVAVAASPVRGAGYVVPHVRAHRGALHLVVPKLTCAAHENSELGARVVIMTRSHVDDGWSGSVVLRCSDGHAKSNAFLECGGERSWFGRVHPGDFVTISYEPEQMRIDVDSGDSGVGAGCGSASGGSGSTHTADHRQVGFLVSTSSKPPKSLQSLKAHVTVAGKKLSTAHPARQSQFLNTKVLRPGPIGTDGRTFTVRVRWR